jgi:hypothetical protein
MGYRRLFPSTPQNDDPVGNLFSRTMEQVRDDLMEEGIDADLQITDDLRHAMLTVRIAEISDAGILRFNLSGPLADHQYMIYASAQRSGYEGRISRAQRKIEIGDLEMNCAYLGIQKIRNHINELIVSWADTISNTQTAEPAAGASSVHPQYKM